VDDDGGRRRAAVLELDVVSRGRWRPRWRQVHRDRCRGLAAEHYRRVISEKTRDALARLRTKGRRVSRFPPYGQRVAAGGLLAADVAEELVLGQIAALSAAGLSLRAISRTLAERGVLARNGRPFAPATLFRLTTSGGGARVTTAAG
jgi:hypothetical protein